MADVSVARELERIGPGLTVNFASYATGREYIQSCGYAVEDLKISLSAEMAHSKTARAVESAIARCSPDVVVSHEIFIAPVVAYAHGKRSLLMTHWFFSNVFPNVERASALDVLMGTADSLVMLDLPEPHVVPELLKPRVEFVGPIVRAELDDPKPVGPAEGNAPGRGFLVLVGGAVEAYWPMLERTLEALALLIRAGSEMPARFVVPRDIERFRRLAARCGVYEAIEVLPFVDNPRTVIDRSQFVLGRGSFTSMVELAALGKPSLQIVDGSNPVDLFHANYFRTRGLVKTLQLRDASPITLAESLLEMASWSDERGSQLRRLGAAYRGNESAKRVASRIVSVMEGSAAGAGPRLMHTG